jgi:hypothetical protein
LFTKRSPVANTDCEPIELGPCSNGRYRRYHWCQIGEQWRRERIGIGDVCRTGRSCQILASLCGVGTSFRRQGHAGSWDSVGLVYALGSFRTGRAISVRRKGRRSVYVEDLLSGDAVSKRRSIFHDVGGRHAGRHRNEDLIQGSGNIPLRSGMRYGVFIRSEVDGARYC